MWKIIILFFFTFYSNHVEATYNTGVKSSGYEEQPLTNNYHHHQSSTPTHGHYNQNNGDNDRDYQTSITDHHVSNDNSRQQQQLEDDYYQQMPSTTRQSEYVTSTKNQYQQQIYNLKGSTQTQKTPGDWQNLENSISEYYTGCPSGFTGQLPYAYDCRRFLNCWQGRGHIQTCSVGTVFNPESLECDRPDKVKCEAALSILGAQSGSKLQAVGQGNLKRPNYRAGRYMDIKDSSVEVLCPAGAVGLQPHPSDCTRFINCDNGNMHIQQCGPGTAYSSSMKVCDFKNKVDCSSREGRAHASASRQTEHMITCPLDASGLHPHPYDCTKFLQCSNGETYIQDCVPGTAFDSARLLCDYPYKVKCCSSCSQIDSAIALTQTIYTQAASSSSSLPSTHITNTQHEDLPHTSDILCLGGLTGLFPYPFDYTKFINCRSGNTAIQNCVPGTAFSISKGYCESLDEIDKSDHVMFIVSQVSYEYSQTLITCPPGTDGVHLYPFNAELYVKCVRSQMKVVSCDNEHVFSVTRKTCLPHAQVTKHERVRLLSELQSTSSYRATDNHFNTYSMVYCPLSLTGSYPHPFDSTKYLKCSRGRLMSESCASGQVFSLSRKICTLKEEMNTDDYVPQAKMTYGHEWRISDMEITHGSIDGLTYLMCPPGLNGYFLHPFDCTKYIDCTQDTTVVASCLNGAVFSISRKECIPRDKVVAYDRVEYMTTTKNEFSSEPQGHSNHDLGISCNPGTFGIYPHPYDSHKYIRCANGRISVENCAHDQVFSLSKSYCHNENEVDNKDRSSYNRGFSVTQNTYDEAVASTQNAVYQAGSYKPVITPQQSLSPPPVDTIEVPAVVLRPPVGQNSDSVRTDNVICPPGANGRYPHLSDCTKFLECTNGKTYVRECASGSAWNKEMEVCDFKEKVNCTQRNSQTQIRCPFGVEGLYQHPYDWRKYLICTDSQTTIMDCAPGTVFSLSRRTCDNEANVSNSDRCNNGIYSSDYDYSSSQHFNGQPSKPHGANAVRSQWSQGGTIQTQSTSQVTENRWTNMNIPRPQGSTTDQIKTWSQNANSYNHNPVNKPDPTRVWSGTAVHVDQNSPTHTVIYEEGSYEPNRNYNLPMYNTPLTPLAPLEPIPSTTTKSTIVYAQPVDSDEDSKEIFSNIHNTKDNTQHFSTSDRQNYTRNLNWIPIRPADKSMQPLIPAHRSPNTVDTNTYTQIPITSQLMPPYQSTQPSVSGQAQVHIPSTHFMPSGGNADNGQRPIFETEFKETSINVDELPGQVSYNLSYFDQVPSGSSRHDIYDANNLYGGLQRPLDDSLTTTSTSNFLDSYESTTQVPPPPKTTTSSYRVITYPHLSNATIQTFPHQPHYSSSYSEVAHSSNTSWLGRKVPQQSVITSTFRNNVNYENTRHELYPPRYSNTKREEDNPAVNDQEATMMAALKLLLKPYIDPKTNDDDIAEKAQSHIMNLVSDSDKDKTVTITTSTHKPLLNQITLTSSTTPHHQTDVELILAGEQHNLLGVITNQTPNHETSESNNLYQTPLQPVRQNIKSSMHSHNHNSNWHKNHQNDPHHSKLQHNPEFHKKHPDLPNPFDDSATPHNSHADATTLRSYDFDLRIGGNCPFDCGNGKCVEQHQVCDGANDCGNRKDEKECQHLGYELRLTGGHSSNMGRVEVKILGKWGYVCDDKFGLRDADVVCRELGFKMGAMEVRGNSYYAPSDLNVHFSMDEVECKGNETSLRECDFKGWGINNCGPDEVVGVVCKVTKLKCPDNYWLCNTSKECIPTAFLCDVTPDCADGSDESEQVCNAPIKYRLEGGRNANEGRLEVFYRGEWGTVCDDDFGLKEAQVFCNSLGLYGKPVLVKNMYGAGSGPIWLDQISCLGNEAKIDECNHWAWGENNCNHTEDVEIKCTAGPKPNPNKVNKAQPDDTSTQRQNIESLLQYELDDLGLYQGLWQRSSKAIHSERKCGHFNTNLLDEYEHPEERVVNGTIAKRGRHPWQATIRIRGRGGISSHWCGAVIISRKLILTAAHCLAGYPKGSYFVRMGDHYANIAESSEVDSNIENWYIHEKFRDQKHMNNDIALILLKNPVHFNDYIQPICLPEKGTTLETDRVCTISGWGSIKSGTSTPSNILRSAQIPILADDVCSQKNIYANAMTEGMFCAGFLDESADACDGDSGGPLVCSDKDGETLYGIISWGQHCGYANHPGVYVRVEKYIDWIYEKIKVMTQQGKL